MGYIRHDAIVVTAGSDEDAECARQKAVDLGLRVSGLVPGTTNGYVSFLIAADGSKEGWEESHRHDAARKAWVEWARTEATKGCVPDKYAKKKSSMRPCWFDWAWVSFGGDEGEYAHLVDFDEKPRE